MSTDTEKLDALHHVAIEIQDIARALDWYTTRFNAEVVYVDETWAMLKFSNIYLAMVTPGQHPPHIAIEHAQAETFGELTRHRDGTESVYIKDSEGNTLELMKKQTGCQ